MTVWVASRPTHGIGHFEDNFYWLYSPTNDVRALKDKAEVRNAAGRTCGVRTAVIPPSLSWTAGGASRQLGRWKRRRRRRRRNWSTTLTGSKPVVTDVSNDWVEFKLLDMHLLYCVWRLLDRRLVLPCRHAVVWIAAAEWYVCFTSNKLLTYLLTYSLTSQHQLCLTERDKSRGCGMRQLPTQ